MLLAASRPSALGDLLGGGLGERHTVLNTQVPPGYRRLDPAAHLAEPAAAADAGMSESGGGLMTVRPSVTTAGPRTAGWKLW
ncbi:adenosylcobinamide amidohydrolase [Streptomyces sp. ISL-100]|uniref:adenosylcobinamide amidohydrolase n=1 Tax=Streptomyces sp. ISL-100 TaxID=2819173 RepID=UPI001BEA6AFE|nr:adenosylcobinamide amidohydrolase [Streptomyces sp. ISL-100]MBT2401520.1 adenosylcobinamide amidohydrolase [Streptomyces sp. ISL-100]